MSLLLEIDIQGTPVCAPKSTNKHMWNEVSLQRINFLQIIKQYQENLTKIIDTSINLEMIFYVKHALEKKGFPNIVLLVDFANYSMEGRIYKRRCQIYSTNAKILIEENERTNIKIMERDENY